MNPPHEPSGATREARLTTAGAGAVAGPAPWTRTARADDRDSTTAPAAPERSKTNAGLGLTQGAPARAGFRAGEGPDLGAVLNGALAEAIPPIGVELSGLLQRTVSLDVANAPRPARSRGGLGAGVAIPFHGGLEGCAVLAFDEAELRVLASWLPGWSASPHEILDAPVRSALLEIGSVALGGIVSACVALLDRQAVFGIPRWQTDEDSTRAATAAVQDRLEVALRFTGQGQTAVGWLQISFQDLVAGWMRAEPGRLAA